MMFLRSSRKISILSKVRDSVLGKNNDISKAIGSENLPKTTGNGPFIELPKFEAIGGGSSGSNDRSQASLLNVTLPASSKLNIRNGSIIAMNGNLNHLTTRLRNLSNFYPLIYQELRSVSPVSVLISGGRSGSSNFVVLDIDGKDDQWVISNSKNVIAWTGYDFQLLPASRGLVNGGGLFRLDSYTGLRTSGKGTLVLSGNNDVFDIELGNGEELLVEPSVLIAHNDVNSARFTTLKGNSLFQLPSFNWIGALGIRATSVYHSIQRSVTKLYRRISGPGKSPQLSSETAIANPNSSQDTLGSISSTFAKTGEFIKNQINRIGQKDIYYHVTGPCKLLISSSNGGIPRRKTFTKEDLGSIKDTLK